MKENKKSDENLLLYVLSEQRQNEEVIENYAYYFQKKYNSNEIENLYIDALNNEFSIEENKLTINAIEYLYLNGEYKVKLKGKNKRKGNNKDYKHLKLFEIFEAYDKNIYDDIRNTDEIFEDTENIF